MNSKARVLSGLHLHGISSTLPFGLVSLALRSFKSLGKSMSGISKSTSHLLPTVGLETGETASSTMISNGEPLTGLWFFLTSNKCLPTSSGVKLIAKEPSGAMSHGTGSFLPDGRVNSALSLSRSSGNLTSSMSKLTSHGEPTVGLDEACSGSSTS